MLGTDLQMTELFKFNVGKILKCIKINILYLLQVQLAIS